MASEVQAADAFRDGSPKGLSPRVIYEASHEGEVISVVMIHSDIVVSASCCVAERFLIAKWLHCFSDDDTVRILQETSDEEEEEDENIASGASKR